MSKIKVVGKHQTFDIKTEDYPNLKFMTEAAILKDEQIHSSPEFKNFEIPLLPSESGCCRHISKEDAYNFFKFSK